MGILINTGFDLGSSSPIDNRTLKNTIDERDALVSEGKVYENLKVYCKDTQKEYRWTGIEWETVGSSGSGTGDIDLSDYYTKTEVNNDFLKKTDADSTYATKTDIETMSSIILDSEVRLDKTYSSSKIYSSIQDAIDTSKAYTLSELGKMSGASYKVVTATNEMTDEKIIYLLDNGTTFDMYIVESGIPTKIGDTDIDLSEYYTKTEVDNDFLKKTDASSIYATKTELNEKANDDEVAKKADITGLQEQIDNLDIPEDVDLTNINTKLTQLETKARFIPVIADNPTDYDLNNYIDNGNYSIGDSSKYSNTPISRPGLLIVIRSNSYRLQIYAVTNNNNVYFRKSTNWGSTWSSWVLLNNSSGASGNVPKTSLTPVFPNGITLASGGVAINYIVRNGWCNVDFEFNVKSATALTWNVIATGLPKPANNVNIVLINDGGKINRTIPIRINSTGSVSLRVPTEITATDWWTGNISYPVAE